MNIMLSWLWLLKKKCKITRILVSFIIVVTAINLWIMFFGSSILQQHQNNSKHNFLILQPPSQPLKSKTTKTTRTTTTMNQQLPPPPPPPPPLKNTIIKDKQDTTTTTAKIDNNYARHQLQEESATTSAKKATEQQDEPSEKILNTKNKEVWTISSTNHIQKNQTSIILISSSKNQSSQTTTTKQHNQQQQHCALMFFGLPRSYELLVLPSIIQNILIPNKDNRCDIYVHYYLVHQEKDSRSGSGGTLDALEILKLHDAVRKVYTNNIDDDDDKNQNNNNNIPFVSITNDTEIDFQRKRGTQLEKYRTTKGQDGNYIYYPWMAKSYTYPTTIDNIVKQWHSINSVWDDMTYWAKRQNKNYTRVAMLRNDAVYVTPFNIYKRGIDTPIDIQNNDVIVPNWARFPINDRMIYGPYKGVKVWATERFDLLEEHVVTYEEPGYGMHSERFLNHSIFPAIQKLGLGVYQDPDICFFRTRVDGSTWINDCATRNGAAKRFRNKINTQALVESIIGKSCRKSNFNKKIIQLHCLPENNNKSNNNTTS